MTCDEGFGAGPWGAGPWGGAEPFGPNYAVAIRENVVLVEFTRVLYWKRTLVRGDAANPKAYTVTEVSGTTGADGLPTRPVRVVHVRQSTEFPDGRHLEVVVDRRMSGYPAEYEISVAGVFEETGIETTSECAVRFHGLARELVPALLSRAANERGRDLANPVLPTDDRLAGTLVTGDDGDYAFDLDAESIKKRIIRRLIARKGSFAHLPAAWGVGVLDYVKQLATPGVQARLVADAQTQIGSEPGVARCRVKLSADDVGVFRLTVLVRTVRGDPIVLDVPVADLVEVT